MKKYNFKDKFGNEYNFGSYVEFAKFWFNQPYKALISYFPDNYKKLNFLALHSKEARTKI